MGSTSASDPSRAAVLYYAGCEDHHYEAHFLKSCFLCNKPLGFNSDIFMYRGDTPFCSKECREEQIEIDESKDKSWKTSSRSSSSSRKTEAKRKTVRTDTVVVA